MKNLMKPITLLLMVFISSAIFFGSCKKDSTSTPADQTALTKLMVSADSLSTAAIPANFPQTDIDNYKATLATVKAAAVLTTITQTQVDNLVVQLNAAMTLFKTKAYSYIDENLYLVAGWHFDEGTGTTATSYSTAKQVGTFTKGWTTILGSAALLPTWVDGVKGGKAIYLDKGAHLEVPYTANLLPANITISAWIKNNLQGWENNCIVSQNFWWGYKFQTQSVGKPLFTERINGTSVQDFDDGDATVTPGVWSHVVVSLNSSTKVLKFYINGVLTHTYTALDGVGALTQTLTYPDDNLTTGYTFTAQPFLIGSFATDAELAAHPLTFSWITAANVASFEGAIDELKIYNTALSDGQVGKLYNDEKP